MDAQKTGAFISSVRTERSMTQKELARLLCVSDKTISRWETGRGYPDIEILPELSKALGVSVNEILKGEYIENDPKDDIDEDIIILSNVANRKQYMRNVKLSMYLTLLSISSFIVVENTITYLLSALSLVVSIVLLIVNFKKYSRRKLSNQILTTCEIIGLIAFDLLYYFVYYKLTPYGTINIVFIIPSLLLFLPHIIDLSLNEIKKK